MHDNTHIGDAEKDNKPSGMMNVIYKKSPWIILFTIIVLMVTLFIQWDELESARRVQVTDNAYVHYDTISIEAKVTGYVRSVEFSDFQSVKKDAALITLEDDDFRLAVIQAEAKRDHAAANLANLALEEELQKAVVRQAQSAAANTKAKLELATALNRRYSKLIKIHAVSAQEAETATAEFKTTRADYEESLTFVSVQEKKLTLLSSEKALREADLKAAEAELETAKLNLSYTRITAPVDSYTGAGKIRIGELVKAGSLVATLVPDATPYIIANYKETQLTRIHPGQDVDIRVDTFPGRSIKGKVSTISHATGATFSLLPKDNTSGNFTKVVQRIPVRIDLLPNQELTRYLRAGMSVITSIDTENSN